MKDECIMNNVLTLSKNICEILVHASIEAANDKVKKAFKDALVDYINVQGKIYKYMEQEGWYKLEQAPTSKVTKVKNKFSSSLKNC